MATSTLKTGTPVIIKDTNQKATITGICKGEYSLSGTKLIFSAGDLVAEKTVKQLKRGGPINKKSDQERKISAIYAIIAPMWKQHNKLCRAKRPGCTRRTTQIHHMYKRTGFYRIMSKYFFPICASCHRQITAKSAEAIADGISISRYENIEYEFNELEKQLISDQKMAFPINKI